MLVYIHNKKIIERSANTMMQLMTNIMTSKTSYSLPWHTLPSLSKPYLYAYKHSLPGYNVSNSKQNLFAIT